MNSSPLNPDAPVFIPGSVAGADVLLAESPRKPLPMDDIELPDVAQFETGAVVRPAELLDLDNCDQLNGHHNVSQNEAITEHLNGNDKCDMDSLGFGFNVGIENEKVKDGLIQDFERIQKDTTDFCNIQVFQTHQETNPFAMESNDELFERLKNKERDPMSMSFYQEKDDDTCERVVGNESHVDLNAVQPLPDSDDEEIQTNGVHDDDKENISPEQHRDLFEIERDIQEPNNDIIRFDDRSSGLAQNIDNFDQGDYFVDYNVTTSNNIESYSNIEFDSNNICPETVLQTDTPESHKLLFEQIPEIPDGKSSELGFTNDEIQEPSESEKEDQPYTTQVEMSQDIEMESKLGDSLCIDTVPQLSTDRNNEGDEDRESPNLMKSDQTAISTNIPDVDFLDEHASVPVLSIDENNKITQSGTPEPTIHDNIVQGIVDFHHENVVETLSETPFVELDTEHTITGAIDAIENTSIPESPLPSKSPFLQESFVPGESPFMTESPLPVQSPIPVDDLLPQDSPLPAELSQPSESPLLEETLQQTEINSERVSAMSNERMTESVPVENGVCTEVDKSTTAESPVPVQGHLSPTLERSELLHESPLPVESPMPIDTFLPTQSLEPSESPLPDALFSTQSPVPAESPLPTDIAESLMPLETSVLPKSPMPIDVSLAGQSPVPTESPAPVEIQIQADSPAPIEFQSPKSPIHIESSIPTEVLISSTSPQPVMTEPAEHDFVYTSESPVCAQLSSPAPPDSSALSPLPVDVPLPGESPLPVDEPALLAPSEPESVQLSSPTHLEPSRVDTATPECESPSPATRLAPDMSTERAVSPATTVAPAPDLVPEEPVQQSRTELVTDVDIGIPESRAQEICVPVTNEIQLEEAVQPPAVTTPPPTPAIDPPVTAADAALLNEIPIAVDAPQGIDLASAAAAGVAAAGAVVGAAAIATKAKLTTATKKSPTTPTAKTDVRTPKSVPKSTTSTRTATTPAAKKPTSAATTPRTPSATKTLTPSTKPLTPSSKAPSSATRTTPAARTPTASKPLVAKNAIPVTKTTAAAKPSAPVRAPASARPAPPKTNGVALKPTREAPAVARSAPASGRTAPAARAAPKTSAPPTRVSAPKTEGPPKPAAARPAPKPASAAARPQPKPAERKPLPNGDTKDVKAPARPQPAPGSRPVPRPTPRAPATATAPTTKPSVPKPLPRATPLDKQSKDLANKRITAKAAPPRTAPSKTAALGVKKAVPKKAPEAVKKEGALNGLANGDAALKAPPSPPAADNALLPDVIA